MAEEFKPGDEVFLTENSPRGLSAGEQVRVIGPSEIEEGWVAVISISDLPVETDDVPPAHLVKEL